MISHYFGGAALSLTQEARLKEMLDTNGADAPTAFLTPASVEQLCSEHDGIDALLDDLASRCDTNDQLLLPGRASSGSGR